METFEDVFCERKELLKLDLISLESDITKALRNKVLTHGKPSEIRPNQLAIKVNLANHPEFKELVLIGGILSFFDADGFTKSLFAVGHYELIDLL